MNQGLGILIGLIFVIIIVTMIIQIFEPQDTLKKISRNLLISKTSISILISSLVIGFSFLYNFFLDIQGSGSGIMELLNMIFFLPVIIPYGIGYGGGSAFAFYLSILVEILILAFFIRLLFNIGIRTNKIEKQ